MLGPRPKEKVCKIGDRLVAEEFLCNGGKRQRDLSLDHPFPK